MTKSTSTLGYVGAATVLVSLAMPAHAQFMGIFQGVSNAVGQVANKVANRAFSGKGEDLQDAHDRFFGQIEVQTAGMDEAARQQHRSMVEQQWPKVEMAILLKNAQLQGAKEGPLIDFKEVAGAAVGGVALQVGMNSAITGAGGMTDVLGSQAMGGLIEGVRSNATAALHGSAGPDAAAASAADLNFTPTDAAHPLAFLGKHPRDLNARDLYRESGFIGWRRVEQSSGAQAYAPVTGQGQARFVVFNFDPETGAMKAAFRVLAASPAAFTSAVDAYSTMLGAKPRYASAGSVLRAVWESGAFVTADASKLTAGWSSLAPELYGSAAAISAK